LEEIVETYEEQVTHQETEETVYQVGSYWKQILEEEKGEFYHPLFEKNRSRFFFNLYNCFHNRGVSSLWEGGLPCRWNEQGARYGFLRDTLDHEREWFVLYDQESEELAFPPHVRCPGLRRPYGNASPAQFKAHYFAKQISYLIEGKKNPVVAEIGGGFSGAAYHLLKWRPDLTYLNFDLPETLIFSLFFLKGAFPERVQALGGHEGLSENLAPGRVTLAQPCALKCLPNASVDVWVNLRSFSEMSQTIIDNYLKEIGRTGRGYLLHDNSNRPLKNEIGADSFPIPSAFRLLSKNKSLWCTGMMGNRFVEYLYQKT
jgi:hypothetical protein